MAANKSDSLPATETIMVGKTRVSFARRSDSVERPALARILEIIDAHEVGAEMDAGFDHGEFSGPAHSKMMHEELDALGDWEPVLLEAQDRWDSNQRSGGGLGITGPRPDVRSNEEKRS